MEPSQLRRFLVLLLTVIQCTQLAALTHRICPIPKCEACLDRSLQSTPGIGFHLGLTSGTVAISYDKNNVTDLVYIAGSPEYISVMQGVARNYSRLDPPPQDTYHDLFNDGQQQLRRRLNLLLGRPATPIAATLSSMLTSLRKETESRLSRPITHISIALAAAAMISREECNDSLSYVGFDKLKMFQVHDTDFAAAYSAYGYGLCSSYDDPYVCEDEEFDMNDMATMQIDYTSNALSLNTASLSSVRHASIDSRLLDWKLGRDMSVNYEHEDDYWKAVKDSIRDRTEPIYRRSINLLLLTGDRADDEMFLEVVKDVFSEMNIVNANQVMTLDKPVDPKFAAARGVAEFQRRRQAGWLGCVQPRRCSRSAWGNFLVKLRQHQDPWAE